MNETSPMVSTETMDMVHRRLARIEVIETARSLRERGYSRAEIAQTMNLSAGQVVRALVAAADGGGREDPEEAIYRAAVENSDRNEFVERLSSMTYMFTEYAPYPFDGSKPGTWMKVVGAYGDRLLTDQEFARVSDAVRPPAAQGREHE